MPCATSPCEALTTMPTPQRAGCQLYPLFGGRTKSEAWQPGYAARFDPDIVPVAEYLPNLTGGQFRLHPMFEDKMTESQFPRGPLAGVRVVEIAGIGPGPFAAMVLSDLGATVIRVDRAGHVPPAGANLTPGQDVLTRGRQSVGVDLKHPDGLETVLRLVETADVLL